MKNIQRVLDIWQTPYMLAAVITAFHESFPARFKPALELPLTFSFESGSICLSVLLRTDKSKTHSCNHQNESCKRKLQQRVNGKYIKIHKNHQQQNNLIYFTLLAGDVTNNSSGTNLACRSFLWIKFYWNTVMFTIDILFRIAFLLAAAKWSSCKNNMVHQPKIGIIWFFKEQFADHLPAL